MTTSNRKSRKNRSYKGRNRKKSSRSHKKSNSYKKGGNGSNSDHDMKCRDGNIDSCYSILGLPRGVTQPRQINGAWRKLSLQHHPDKGGNEEIMRAINNAKDTLIRYITQTRRAPRPTPRPSQSRRPRYPSRHTYPRNTGPTPRTRYPRRHTGPAQSQRQSRQPPFPYTQHFGYCFAGSCDEKQSNWRLQMLCYDDAWTNNQRTQTQESHAHLLSIGRTISDCQKAVDTKTKLNSFMIGQPVDFYCGLSKPEDFPDNIPDNSGDSWLPGVIATVIVPGRRPSGFRPVDGDSGLFIYITIEINDDTTDILASSLPLIDNRFKEEYKDRYLNSYDNDSTIRERITWTISVDLAKKRNLESITPPPTNNKSPPKTNTGGGSSSDKKNTVTICMNPDHVMANSYWYGLDNRHNESRRLVESINYNYTLEDWSRPLPIRPHIVDPHVH